MRAQNSTGQERRDSTLDRNLYRPRAARRRDWRPRLPHQKLIARIQMQIAIGSKIIFCQALWGAADVGLGAAGRCAYPIIALSLLSGRTFTLRRAGLAATFMVSPGRNGLGTPFLAGRAGVWTTLTLSNPGSVNIPTDCFAMCRSINAANASSTRPTSFLGSSVLAASSASISPFAHRLVELRRLLCHHILPFEPKETGGI